MLKFRVGLNFAPFTGPSLGVLGWEVSMVKEENLLARPSESLTKEFPVRVTGNSCGKPFALNLLL